MSPWRFKLLYDGQCSLCVGAVKRLRRRDPNGRLALEDISAPAFDPAPYGLTREEVAGSLHGVFPDGRVVRGVDALHQAYEELGSGWLLAPARWPILRDVADALYAIVAKSRSIWGRPHGHQHLDES